MNNFLRFTIISFLLILVGGWACSSPGSTSEPDEDTCAGDACLAGDTETETSTGKDADIPDPDATEDQGEDKQAPCEDECEEGEIQCDGDEVTKYRQCKEKDGCLQWSSKALCFGDNMVCACGAVGDVCIPEAEEYCTCQNICEEGWECGPDGCGDVCGDVGCGDDELCVDHMCVEDVNCECPGGNECGEFETQCNGAEVLPCINIYADSACPDKCWKFGDSELCGEFQTCLFDECTCEFTECPTECCPSTDHVCLGDGCCLPDCGVDVCGDDGCGGSCGECDEGCFCSGGECDCSGNCPADECDEGIKICTADKQGFIECVPLPEPCTDSFVNALAQACPSGTECIDGDCQCKPNCTGKECGSDGCDGGGTCGECQEGWSCSEEGLCECTCEPIDNQVCDIPNGVSYPNMCEATCAGVPADDIDKGACPTCEDLCSEDETGSGEICAVDGTTYPDFCQLKCAIGNQDCELGDCDQVKYAGACKPDNCDICDGEEFDPLCNLDDMTTYFSKCDFLSCYPDCDPQNCVPASNICQGECPNDVECPGCTADCEPVCGLLGGVVRKTYMNDCMLNCEGADFYEDGDCCVHCDNEALDWLCGSDYKVYDNQCKLTCKNPQLDPLYLIPQNPDGSYYTEVCEICQVDLSGEPEEVCGDNYQTYYNADALFCASELSGNVGAEPKCDAECFTPDCPCPPSTGGLVIPGASAGLPDTGQRGVCGADGATYANKCEAIFMGTTVASNKWCDSCNTEDTCMGEVYEPFCCVPPGASFGVTYPNGCIPQKCNPNLEIGECNKGRCCLVDGDCQDGETCNPVEGLVSGTCE